MIKYNFFLFMSNYNSFINYYKNKILNLIKR